MADRSISSGRVPLLRGPTILLTMTTAGGSLPGRVGVDAVWSGGFGGELLTFR